MTGPYHPTTPLPERVFAGIRRDAVFECCKWDPQVGDVDILAPLPLILDAAAWREVSDCAEALAREALAAEAELVQRPELHRLLGLPREVERALRQAVRAGPSAGAARLMRFDFHVTPDGWRISEVNSDVPGGFNEAEGFTRLLAPHYPGTRPTGAAASALAAALAQAAGGPGRRAALVHATAFTDDRQVMVYLARCLARLGVEPLLCAPDHVGWEHGHARLEGLGAAGPVDVVVRFFPAEWLTALPRARGWLPYFAGSRTPHCNPGTALLTQSKRFPLVWDALRTPLPTWRAALPETRDPRRVNWAREDGWVLKPALGRVGEGIGIRGVTPEREWTAIARDVRRNPEDWVAQRRFEASAFDLGDGPRYPCLGVYTVDARVVGAYGRGARKPLTDSAAQDLAVLLQGDAIEGGEA
jgi:glutathionylspermidine synthase